MLFYYYKKRSTTNSCLELHIEYFLKLNSMRGLFVSFFSFMGVVFLWLRLFCCTRLGFVTLPLPCHASLPSSVPSLRHLFAMPPYPPSPFVYSSVPLIPLAARRSSLPPFLRQPFPAGPLEQNSLSEILTVMEHSRSTSHSPFAATPVLHERAHHRSNNTFPLQLHTMPVNPLCRTNTLLSFVFRPVVEAKNGSLWQANWTCFKISHV